MDASAPSERALAGNDMPTYYFRFTDGRHDVPDLEGVELTDLPAARNYAVEDARFLIETRMIRRWRAWRVEITGESGEILASIPFKVVAIPGAERSLRGSDHGTPGD